MEAKQVIIYEGTVWGDLLSSDIVPGDTAFMAVCTALVFFMTPGLGVFYAGLVRRKNVMSLFHLCMLSMVVVSLQWYLWGFSLAFSDEPTNGFIGDFKFALLRKGGLVSHPGAPTIPFELFALFQMMCAAVTPAITFGSAAERVRILPSMVFLFIWMTLVYSVTCYWAWGPHGWLYELGFLDFAGGSMVHIGCASAALAFAIFLGPRVDLNSANNDHVPHNLTYVQIGTGILWFGWFGFNGGSAMKANARAAASMTATHLSACVAALVFMALEYRTKRNYNSLNFCGGVLAGLVTATPASGFISPSSSLAFGLLGGVICYYGLKVKHLLKFDDALDTFGIHLVGGSLGLFLAGIFAQRNVISLGAPIGTNTPAAGWLDGVYDQVPIQLAGIFAVAAYSFTVTYLILYVVDKIPGLHFRLSAEDEALGTDKAELDEQTYDFVPAKENPADGAAGEGSRHSGASRLKDSSQGKMKTQPSSCSAGGPPSFSVRPMTSD